MRILKIFKNDIGNGPGIRISIWCSGCTHECPECHNPETWDFDQGRFLDMDIMKTIIEEATKPEVEGITITGGDPLHPQNASGTEFIAKCFKEAYPEKTVWVWTGYLWEKIQHYDLSNIDVIVDGLYNRKLRNVMLPYSGSSNQRVIDVKKSLESGVVTEINIQKSTRKL